MNNQKAEQIKGLYKSITIQGFRLFEYLELKDLAPINLIFGPNNTGKSSVLEAIYAHACGYNFDPFLRQCVLRRKDQPTTGIGVLDMGEQILQIFRNRAFPPFRFTITAEVTDAVGQQHLFGARSHQLTCSFKPGPALANLDPRGLGQPSAISFPDLNSDVGPLSRIEQPHNSRPISGPERVRLYLGTWSIQIDGGETMEHDLRIPLEITLVSPLRQAVMHDILNHRNAATERRVFSFLKRYRLLPEFVAQMAQVFDEVQDIDLLPFPDDTPGVVMVIGTDGQARPLYVAGDGMRRWFYLLGNLIVFQNAVHCIEEIDATLHPNAQQNLAPLLVQYTRQTDNQLFITSHSIEFLDSFLTALYKEENEHLWSADDPVRVLTILAAEPGAVPEVWSRTGLEALEDRRKYAMELRG